MAVAITTTMQNQIANLYIAILGRNPDPTGFGFWTKVYADANGTPAALNNIAAGFGKGDEFTSTYGALTSTQAVNQMYLNILGRAADSAGSTYWSGIADGYIKAGASIGDAYSWTANALITAAASNTGTADSTLILAKQATAVAAGTATPTTTYTLTTNIDTYGNAASSAQQIFNAANGTFTSLDTLTGGTATNDTLNVAVTGAYTTPVGVTVANVDIINVTSTTGAVISTATAATGFTGVRALNVVTAAGALTATAASTTALTVTNSTPGATVTTALGGSTVTATVNGAVTGSNLVVGSVAAAPTGAVVATLNSTMANGGAAATTAGATVAVIGGTTVNVSSTQTGNAAGALATTGTTTIGNISVTGTSATTTVTVTQSAGILGADAAAAAANASNAVVARAGVNNGQVTIADVNAGSTTAAATITAVTLANYQASTISSNALTSLTLSNSTATGAIAAGTLGLTYGLTTGNPTALALNLGGGTLGVVTDNSNVIATLNTALTANTTLGGFAGTALRTVNLSGTGILTLSAVNTAITAITNTSAAAGLNANVSALTGLTSLNFASTSATNTVTLNAALQSYTGGTGNDVVTIGVDALQTITGGTGTDTLVLSATAATYTAANTVAKVTGFETLQVTNVGGGTYNMNTLTGFSNIQVNVAASTNAFGNVAANTGLQLLTGTTAVTYTLAGTNGAASAVTVSLNAPTSGAGFTTTALTLQDSNLVGVGTVNIVSNAPVFQGLHTITTLTSSNLSNLNITGTGSLTITNAATSATSLTISDNGTGTSATPDGFGTLTSTGDVLGQINYSGTHAFTTTLLVDNVANLTIANANTGTTGVFTVAGHVNTNAAAASLTLTGSVAYSGNANAATGAFTLSAGTDNSNITFSANDAAATVKTFTVGNGTNVLTSGGGRDVITTGTGANTITGGALGDTITLGAGTASSAIVYAAAAETYSAGNVTSGVTALLAAGLTTASTDIIRGITAGDTLNLVGISNTFTGAITTTLNAAATTQVGIVRGNYNTTSGIFTTSATGTDSLIQWDGDAAAGGAGIETAVLVGFVNTASSVAAGIVTFA